VFNMSISGQLAAQNPLPGAVPSTAQTLDGRLMAHEARTGRDGPDLLSGQTALDRGRLWRNCGAASFPKS
jgi:hypothetical protein